MLKKRVVSFCVLIAHSFIIEGYNFNKPSLPFPRKSSVRKASLPFISGDTFRSFCDHIFDETEAVFDPTKVKKGDTIFVNGDRGMLQAFFSQAHPLIAQPYILICHNSDHPVPGKCANYLNDSKIIAWYSQNIDRAHPKLFILPIGLANYHWPHGKIEIIKEVMKELPNLEDRSDKLYVNFLKSTNAKIRNQVWDFYNSKPFCYMASRKGYKGYLQEMAQHKFVLSPPGNGIDCHRTWEALLLGCIPVVQHSSIDSLFEKLPVILIKNWQEVTESFLEDSYKIIKQKVNTFNLSKRYIDYWFDLIKDRKV